MTMASAATIGGGISAAGSLGSALIGSSSASTAAQEAVAGENASLAAGYSGTQSAASALSPYYIGGLTDYDLLQYGLTGTTPTSSSTSANWQQYATQGGTDMASAIGNLESYINNFYTTRGGQSGKYGAAYETAVGDLQQLQLLQQQQAAQTSASSAVTSSGIPANYFTKAATTPFSYDVSTDTNLAASEKMANSQIAAQQAAGGGFGSGNMASSIATELAGTLEPTYYNQALGTYQQNYINTPQSIYNMLSGQSGSSTASSLASLYSGSGTSSGNTQSSIGQSNASGTSASSAATTNALTGVGNAATSGVNTYANYSNQSQLAALMKQLTGGTSGSYSPANYYIFGGTDSD
jgi:hypothetical protein